MTQFVARLGKLLVTPAKENAGHLRNVRLQFDAPDPIDPADLLDLVGADVVITVEPAPLPLTPMEEYAATLPNGRH